MKNDPIRVGIVGAGDNTRAKHIPGLQAIEGVEIISVCNRGRKSSERAARQFGIPKVYDNWLELVEAPDTNAIVIGTWPDLHAPVTRAALEADKHVLCEARMAMNAKEAHEMLEAARKRPHLIAQVVPSPFTLRVDRVVKRLLADGYPGEVLAIDVQSRGAFLDREAALTWRQDFNLGGLNVLSLGIWYEAVMRWVGEAIRVMAMGKTFVKMRTDPQTGTLRAVRVPEQIDVLAEMACGAQAHFGISAVQGLGGTDEVTLFGSEGTLRFAEGKLYGGRKGDPGLKEIEILPAEEGRWRVEEEFIRAIRGQEKITRTTFSDGVQYMEFTEAAARSMAEKRAVALPLGIVTF
ncbi:MAG TPA: Gfo/Idh/MocA family oxidoreductase [Bacteroidetes bacterium]|nr:Gfo/Idh/MocA family oxidoreductase [Bacteroidota bacterium]